MVGGSTSIFKKHATVREPFSDATVLSLPFAKGTVLLRLRAFLSTGIVAISGQPVIDSEVIPASVRSDGDADFARLFRGFPALVRPKPMSTGMLALSEATSGGSEEAETRGSGTINP